MLTLDESHSVWGNLHTLSLTTIEVAATNFSLIPLQSHAPTKLHNTQTKAWTALHSPCMSMYFAGIRKSYWQQRHSSALIWLCERWLLNWVTATNGCHAGSAIKRK